MFRIESVALNVFQSFIYLSIENQRFFRIVQHIEFNMLQILLTSVEYLNRIIAGMQVLQNFGNNLTLCTGVLLAHGSVHQFDNVLVEMRYKMIQILVVCLCVQALATNPLYGVPKETKSAAKLIRANEKQHKIDHHTFAYWSSQFYLAIAHHANWPVILMTLCPSYD